MTWKCGINEEDNQFPAMGVLIQNTRTGARVYMPKKDAFEYIRFRVADSADGGRGDRLADAYEKAGPAFVNILPSADILPCIKRIYTNFKDARDSQRTLIFRPYGDWVFQEACNCLNIYDPETGRSDLGDGFIVPSDSEQACIVDRIYNKSEKLELALKSCCPDITYPIEQIGLIEDSLKQTGYKFYNIISIAHTAYLQAHYPTPRIDLGNGLIVPASDEILNIEAGLNAGNDITTTYNYYGLTNILPPEGLRKCIEAKILAKTGTWDNIFKSCLASGGKTEPEPEKSNTIIYVLLGVGLLLLWSRKT